MAFQFKRIFLICMLLRLERKLQSRWARPRTKLWQWCRFQEELFESRSTGSEWKRKLACGCDTFKEFYSQQRLVSCLQSFGFATEWYRSWGRTSLLFLSSRSRILISTKAKKTKACYDFAINFHHGKLPRRLNVRWHETRRRRPIWNPSSRAAQPCQAWPRKISSRLRECVRRFRRAWRWSFH